MDGKLVNDIKRLVFVMLAALQVVIDCKFLGIPDNITPVVAVAVVFGLWWATRPRRKAKRNPVKMYTVGRMD